VAENLTKKIRRVYRAQKAAIGNYKDHHGGVRDTVRNAARLRTASIVGVPVAEVKHVLAATAGAQTTKTQHDERAARA
jgi:hypothetical protein